MQIPDETLSCVDCNAEFPFSSGEAEFYRAKALSKPKRCKACRAAKKARNGEKKPQVAPADDGLGF